VSFGLAWSMTRFQRLLSTSGELQSMWNDYFIARRGNFQTTTCWTLCKFIEQVSYIIKLLPMQGMCFWFWQSQKEVLFKKCQLCTQWMKKYVWHVQNCILTSFSLCFTLFKKWLMERGGWVRGVSKELYLEQTVYILFFLWLN